MYFFPSFFSILYLRPLLPSFCYAYNFHCSQIHLSGMPKTHHYFRFMFCCFRSMSLRIRSSSLRPSGHCPVLIFIAIDYPVETSFSTNVNMTHSTHFKLCRCQWRDCGCWHLNFTHKQSHRAFLKMFDRISASFPPKNGIMSLLSNINSQLDVTILILLTISISSTCFGRYFLPIFRSTRLCLQLVV